MLDKTYIISASCDSLASRSTEECGGGDAQESLRGSARSSPLKDASNLPDRLLISRHNPDRTYRRETVIASWRGVRREREAALGRRTVAVPAATYRDYLERPPAAAAAAAARVKRCRSDVASERPRVQRRVKRTCSVFYRYDPSAEQVVKEYAYLAAPSLAPQQPRRAEAPAGLHKSRSESHVQTSAAAAPAPSAPGRKVRRSLTAILKTRILNIFAGKS